MSFTYPTVTIDSNVYSVYGNLDAANAYLAATISAAGVAWRAADTTKQARALVSSVRWLEEALWIGDKSDSEQELAWPRTNITDVDDTSIPDQALFASFELAAALAEDVDLRTTLKAPGVREQHAGPVGQTFFRPKDVQVLTLFPAVVMALIGQWLKGRTVGIQSYGTSGETRINDTYETSHGI